MKNNGIIERKSIVKIRNGFSQDIGISNVITEMQYEEFDNRTRIIIGNKIHELLETFFEKASMYDSYINLSNEFSKEIISEILCRQITNERDSVYNWNVIYNEFLFNIIQEVPYNEVLDVVWFICDWINRKSKNLGLRFDEVAYKWVNVIFEREYVGYRFVDGRIIQITDKEEINDIEKACNSKYLGVRVQIKKAVAFLAERENKDYKNCIKESISAVESMCRIIANDSKATLGSAIKKIKEKGIEIHPSLESAFTKLYGYTSDKGGIRHSEGLGESEVTFAEARFMLVCCSAFINYLTLTVEASGRV